MDRAHGPLGADSGLDSAQLLASETDWATCISINYYHYIYEYRALDTMDDSAMTSSSMVRAADRIVVARRTVWRVDRRTATSTSRCRGLGARPSYISKKKLPNFVLPDGAGAQHDLAAVTLHDDLELDGPRR